MAVGPEQSAKAISRKGSVTWPRQQAAALQLRDLRESGGGTERSRTRERVLRIEFVRLDRGRVSFDFVPRNLPASHELPSARGAWWLSSCVDLHEGRFGLWARSVSSMRCSGQPKPPSEAAISRTRYTREELGLDQATVEFHDFHDSFKILGLKRKKPRRLSWVFTDPFLIEVA